MGFENFLLVTQYEPESKQPAFEEKIFIKSFAGKHSPPVSIQKNYQKSRQDLTKHFIKPP